MPEIQTETVQDVPVFAIGVWNGVKIKPENLDSMVDSFDKLKETLTPPLKLGHGEDQSILKESGLPSAGWVTNVKRVGNEILATFSNVPKIIAELIRKKAYRFVSPEVLPSYSLNGQEYPWTLWGVAILGNEVPAIKTLGDISSLFGAKPDNFSSMVMCFSQNNEGLKIQPMIEVKHSVRKTGQIFFQKMKKFTAKPKVFSTPVNKFESLDEILEEMGVESLEELSPEEVQEVMDRLQGEEFASAIKKMKNKSDIKKFALKKMCQIFKTKIIKYSDGAGDGGGTGGAQSVGSTSLPSQPSTGSANSEYHVGSAMPNFAVGEGFNRKIKKAKKFTALKTLCQQLAPVFGKAKDQSRK